jgi:hypothetical protein
MKRSMNASEVHQRLVGTWKLVQTEETLRDGSTRPFEQFGPQGSGYLMYQTDGYMSAFLVNPNAKHAPFAYCGRYEVDVQQKHIIHLPEIATQHSFANSRQIRPYQFDGERLIFSDAEEKHSSVLRWKIVWERVHV